MHEHANYKLAKMLRSTAQNDANAFKSLYDATSPRLFAIAQSMMREPSLAEDVLQEAFVHVWHRAGDYHAGRGSVFTWLITIVRYRAVDMLRKRRDGGPFDNVAPLDTESSDPNLPVARYRQDSANNSKHGPVACAISREESDSLCNCVDRLSNIQQRSIVLAFFRGFTHREIAQCMSQPLGATKSRLRRSLLRLKDCLGSLGDDEVRRPAN